MSRPGRWGHVRCLSMMRQAGRAVVSVDGLVFEDKGVMGSFGGEVGR